MLSAGFEFSETRPEFARLSEEEVWAALDKNDDNRIACEVTRLICCFWKKFIGVAGRHPVIAPEILQVSVRCPIERVAVMLMAGYIRAQTSGSNSIMLH